MPKEKILIVEDEKNLAKLIRYNMEREGYECYMAKSGEEAIGLLNKHAVDMILLDIMLPGMDGFEVCRKIKQSDKLSNIPIIMVTAKGAEVDRVVGLELGADDYVVKPFSPRELSLRVKTILKRQAGKSEKKELIGIEDILIDLPSHKVTVKGKEIPLTLKEFNLLLILVQRRGRVQSRDTLLSDVWGIDTDIETRTLDTHIKRLREKLGKSGKVIETIRGIGYKIES